MTPLPAASPEALITTGRPTAEAPARAAAASVNRAARAVATPASRMTPFAKTLDQASICRRSSRRAEDREPRIAVHDRQRRGSERDHIGADEGEVWALSFGDGDETGQVGHRDRDTAGKRGDPRITRGRDQLDGRRLLVEAPGGQRMLAGRPPPISSTFTAASARLHRGSQTGAGPLEIRDQIIPVLNTAGEPHEAVSNPERRTALGGDRRVCHRCRMTDQALDAA